MKTVRIVIAVVFVAVLVYFAFAPLPGFVREGVAWLFPPSPEEKEVRGVFTHYAGLFVRGDPRCEGVYMPNAKFFDTQSGPHGDPRPHAAMASQYLEKIEDELTGIRSGQLHIHFDDVLCRLLPNGKVLLSCKKYFGDGHAEHLSMLFVNTGPQRWAVSEEKRRG